jgi:very-short-patch-repair endonuclease
MVAVLACGPGAVLSHRSAAALWGFGSERDARIDVSIPFAHFSALPGVRVHRRYGLRPEDVRERSGIPVTSPIRTLLDFAAEARPAAIERAVNEADRVGLVEVGALRQALVRYRGERGVGRLRKMLDTGTFRLTDSELERRFLRLVGEAGLPTPLTQQRLNGFRVDFFWPELGLVVETDGLRYHRTPAQQARDRLRDQAHLAAGLTPLRFTHRQVRFEADHVRSILLAVANRLGGA